MFSKTVLLSLCCAFALADVPWPIELNNQQSQRSITIKKILAQDCWNLGDLREGSVIYAGRYVTYSTSERTSGRDCTPSTPPKPHHLMFTAQDGGQTYTVSVYRHPPHCLAYIKDQSGKETHKSIGSCAHVRRVRTTIKFYNTGFPALTIGPGKESNPSMEIDPEFMEEEMQDEKSVQDY